MQYVKTYAVKAAAVFAIIALAFWLAHLARENTFFQEMVTTYGYVGIFLVSFASGFNLLIPIPAISLLPLYAEAGLHLPLTIAIITIGMTAADSLAYLLGRLGRDIIKETDGNRVVRFFDQVQTRYKVAPLVVIYLYASLAPLPNEILVIPLALMKYPYLRLAPLILAGNATFNTLSALGILNIFKLFA